MIRPNQSFYLIELGGQPGVDAPIILWQNGAGTFQFESFNTDNMVEAMTVNKTAHLNVSTTSLTEIVLENQNSTSLFCQNPFITSFCIDSNALIIEMTKVGETFLEEKIETTMISTFTCINFCLSQSANVSQH